MKRKIGKIDDMTIEILTAVSVWVTGLCGAAVRLDFATVGGWRTQKRKTMMRCEKEKKAKKAKIKYDIEDVALSVYYALHTVISTFRTWLLTTEPNFQVTAGTVSISFAPAGSIYSMAAL